MFTLANPSEWWFDISPEIQALCWQNSQLGNATGDRRTIYLNQISLEVLLPWLQTEYDSAAVSWLALTELPVVWEMMNGTAVAIGTLRLVFIPTEVNAGNELEVPQEWVDLPSWAADYYLAVHVNVQEQWVRTWGYTTHRDLKMSHYDPDDRTYCMDGENLTRDLSALWMTREFCPQEQTRATIAPLPNLDLAQASNLIERLSNPSILFPRLAVPFPFWGALLEQPEWRRQLVQQRQATQQQTTATSPTQLWQWIQGGVALGWQSIHTFLDAEPNLLFGFRAMGSSDTETGQTNTQIKSISWASQPDDQAVLLVVGLTIESEERIVILAQIHPNSSSAFVPAGLILSLCSETGEVLQTVQARSQDNYIQLPPFRGTPDTRFSLLVALESDRHIEDFVI